MGLPLNHPFLDGIIPNKSHPAIGVPKFLETPISCENMVFMLISFLHDDKPSWSFMDDMNMLFMNICAHIYHVIPLLATMNHYELPWKSPWKSPVIPGKLLHNYGKSPFFMGKSPFFMGKPPFFMGNGRFLPQWQISSPSWNRDFFHREALRSGRIHGFQGSITRWRRRENPGIFSAGTDGKTDGGFHSHGGTPIAGWFLWTGKSHRSKWMIFLGVALF